MAENLTAQEINLKGIVGLTDGLSKAKIFWCRRRLVTYKGAYMVIIVKGVHRQEICRFSQVRVAKQDVNYVVNFVDNKTGRYERSVLAATSLHAKAEDSRILVHQRVFIT